MQKSTIYCAIAGMLLLCGGCSKMKDDIDTLKKPIPTALVILNPEYIVQNGKTFDIPFRVNPSNFVVTKENLSLDVPASQITRSSYGTSIPEYELTDVQPHKDAQGGTIDGEWIATVSIKSGAYYSSSLIALVLKYEDANGQQVQITSTYLGDLTTTVKLTPDMVAMKLFSACSYAKLDGSAYLYTPVTLLARPISSGSETLFDLSTVRVDSCKVDAPDEIQGMFWLETRQTRMEIATQLCIPVPGRRCALQKNRREDVADRSGRRRADHDLQTDRIFPYRIYHPHGRIQTFGMAGKQYDTSAVRRCARTNRRDGRPVQAVITNRPDPGIEIHRNGSN